MHGRTSGPVPSSCIVGPRTAAGLGFTTGAANSHQETWPLALKCLNLIVGQAPDMRKRETTSITAPEREKCLQLARFLPLAFQSSCSSSRLQRFRRPTEVVRELQLRSSRRRLEERAPKSRGLAESHAVIWGEGGFGAMTISSSTCRLFLGWRRAS